MSAGPAVARSDAAQPHRPAVRFLRIASLQELRAFFGPLDDVERAWRSRHSFDVLLGSARAKLGIGEHDRAEAYVFGGAGYPSGDEAALARHFPVHAKHIAVDTLTLSEGETLDLSVAANDFPWPVGPSEIYLKVSVRRLEARPGASLAVRGNVFMLDCNELHAVGGPGRLRIELGDGGRAADRRRLAPAVGSAAARRGAPGARGADGTPARRVVTPFSTHLLAEPERCAGQPGASGGDGMPGRDGDNGGMLYVSDLRFGRIAGFENETITLEARAGTGQPGGAGGDGGTGGAGGNGAEGLPQLHGGGAGGSGGFGGNGGRGGRGGNGGLACDIYVSAPAGSGRLFTARTAPSAGAAGGAGGAGGGGGKGGAHGLYSPARLGGAAAPDGRAGEPGRPGLPGKQRPAPRLVLFERNGEVP